MPEASLVELLIVIGLPIRFCLPYLGRDKIICVALQLWPFLSHIGVGPAEARPADGLAVDFVVESDRAQLSEIVQRVRDGRLRTNIGNIATLDDAVATFNATERRAGKTVIRVRP